ncbi:unnamed protein product [Symbiodinium natans]|uniref:Uncharacterized protein n=1 Tax=Symbiodinium natans TaxID=878477 RepID=A0A812IQA7_9DINO|nr:unnamed protein product [Symbiodinium natans]
MQLRWSICLVALLRPCIPEQTCSDESSCKAFDTSNVLGPLELARDGEMGQPNEAGLVTLQVASDGIRWQIGHVLPERRSRDLQRSAERLAEGAISPLRMTDTELLVVLRGLQGRIRGTRLSLVGDAQGMEDLGWLEDGSLPRATALSRLSSQGALAVGHRAGLASVWRYQEQGKPGWALTSTAKVSHHEWESVILTVLSDDSRLLLAASEDNVMLFYLFPAQNEPKELFHLHGGASQVSAACILHLTGEAPRYLLVLAMQRGGLQGWMVDESGARVIWKIPRASSPIISRLDLAQTSEPPTTLLLAAGDGSGIITVWSLNLNGELASPNNGRWSQAPSRRALPISGLQLLHIKPAMVGILRYGVMAPQWLLSVSTEKDVYVLDALKGSVLHRVEESLVYSMSQLLTSLSTQKVVELLHVFASLLRIVRLVRMGAACKANQSTLLATDMHITENLVVHVRHKQTPDTRCGLELIGQWLFRTSRVLVTSACAAGKLKLWYGGPQIVQPGGDALQDLVIGGYAITLVSEFFAEFGIMEENIALGVNAQGRPSGEAWVQFLDVPSADEAKLGAELLFVVSKIPKPGV